MATESRPIAVQSVFRITCDRCGKSASSDDDLFEFQEYVSIKSECGYGSIFHDMATIEADLCQECVLSLMGGFLRVTPHWIPIVPEIGDEIPKEIDPPEFMDEIE